MTPQDQPQAQPGALLPCPLGCIETCKAKEHGCASECPSPHGVGRPSAVPTGASVAWPNLGGGESLWTATNVDRAPEGPEHLYYIFEGVCRSFMSGKPECMTEGRREWIKNGTDRMAMGPLGWNHRLIQYVTGAEFASSSPTVMGLTPEELEALRVFEEHDNETLRDGNKGRILASCVRRLSASTAGAGVRSRDLMDWMANPPEAAIESAILSYWHGYGLLTDENEKANYRFQAKEWLWAWAKEMLEPPVEPFRRLLSTYPTKDQA